MGLGQIGRSRKPDLVGHEVRQNLVSNEDRRHTRALGTDWAALNPDSLYFKVVSKEDVQEVLGEVAKL